MVACRRHHHGQPVGLGHAAPRRGDAGAAGGAARDPHRLGASHAGPAARVCHGSAAARTEGDHRRRRRRRASAGHVRRLDAAAGARRAGGIRTVSRAWTACFRSCRCRPASRSGRWRSAAPARSTRRCWRPPSWPPATRRWPRGWTHCARSRRRGRWPTDPGMTSPLPPNSTIGLVGGGQLGRMSALAAARLGYRCHILTREKDSPASQVSAATTISDYHAPAGLRRIRRRGRRHQLRVRECQRGRP